VLRVAGGIVGAGRARRAREQQLTDDSSDNDTTTARRELQGERERSRPLVLTHSAAPICTGGLALHAQVLRQSAARRALLDVDVFSAKPHPLACSLFFPVDSSDGALPAGMGLVRCRERGHITLPPSPTPTRKTAIFAGPCSQGCASLRWSQTLPPPAASASLAAGPSLHHRRFPHPQPPPALRPAPRVPPARMRM
jgi:hypothetical protein